MNAAPHILDFPTPAGTQPAALPFAVFVVDPTGRIASWSLAAARATGYTAAEVAGAELAILFLPDARVAGHPFTDLARAARSGVSEYRGWLLRKDSQRTWSQIVLTALRDARGMIVSFVVHVSDLTEARAEEERVLSRADQLSALDRTRREVESSLSLAQLLPKIAARARELTGAEAAIIELREGMGERARAFDGRADLDIELGAVLMPHEEMPGPTPRCLIYDSHHESPEILGDVCDRSGVGSMLAIPIVHDRNGVGWLAVMSRSPHAFEEEAAASLELMSTLLGAPIVQAQASEVRRDLVMERSRAQEAHRESEARFRAAMDASLDAFFILGAYRDAGALVDFTVLDANRKAEELCGLGHGAFWGQRLSALPSAGAQIAPLATLATVVRTGRALEQERQTTDTMGRAQWVQEQIVPLGDGVTVTVRDVTARVLADTEVRRAREAAETANRAKTDFVARMSHELRTPLNSVIGFANVLLRNRRSTFDDTELDYLTRVSAAGTHLLGLVNDVLDIAKIEAGHLTLEIAPVDVVALVDSVITQMDTLAVAGGLTLRLETTGEPMIVQADAGRLRQVLINLVGNAIKFTPAGSVTVRLLGEDATTGPSIEISDTGIGIPADRLGAVFDAFEQAESSTSRRYGGTGLGLAISRALCDAMGLTLTVDSALGNGATFRIGLR
ncbi:MAG: ATP-binding protein [Gemmatimonadota bacterium]